MHVTSPAPDRIPRLTETQPWFQPSAQHRTNVPAGSAAAAAAAAAEPLATACPEHAACAKFFERGD